MSRAVDTATATHPTKVIVGDRIEPRSSLIEALVERGQTGSTVAFGMKFLNFTKPVEINEIFAVWSFLERWGTQTHSNRSQSRRTDEA